MHIPYSDLAALVGPERLSGKRVSTLLSITYRQFCGPMTVHNLCTENCADCQEALIRAFTMQNPRNWEALLTWSMRNALAEKRDETLNREVKERRTSLGLPASENSRIDQLMRELGY